MYSILASLGRHTLSGLLCTSGQQFVDWSAAYRLFENERFEPDLLFAPVRRAVLDRLPEGFPVVAALDDTLVHKTGKRVHGAAWRRDPLGAPFGVSFTWAQRHLQTTLLLPEHGWTGQARALPVDLVHAPTPKRPRRNASEEDWRRYRDAQQRTRLGEVARQRIHHLRSTLDADPGGQQRTLLLVGDGGYTNGSVYRDLPNNTVLIGRLRKDAKLYAPPEQLHGRGRRRLYGNRLLTPEMLRQEESIPWKKVKTFAAGKMHLFRVKVLSPVRWKPAGGRDLTVIAVRPISYRPRKGARLLYRDPAYLVCTEPHLSLQKILQAYVWRWDIEVAFHEEKSLLGLGEAQVRTPSAVPLVPAMVAACYGILHAAAAQAGVDVCGLPLPKWRREPPPRPSTARLVNQVRAELWGKALGVHFDGFVQTKPQTRSHLNSRPSLSHAVLYASG